MGLRPRGYAALTAVALAAAVLGRAEPANAQDIAAAEALFRQGRALLDQGDYEHACPKLAESQRLDPSSGTLLNLATCHQKQGKIATAWAEFLAAARLAKTQGKTTRAEEATKRAAELEKDLSYLTIVVADPVPGLEVKRDGTTLEASVLGSQIPVDPGDHVLTISAAGYATRTITVTIGSSHDSKSVTVPGLEKLPDEPVRPVEPARSATPAASAAPTTSPPANSGSPVTPPSTPTAPTTGGESTTLGWIVLGTGVVATGVGATFGFLAIGAYSDADAACTSHRNCSPDSVTLRDRAETRANIANLGLGLGVVGVGVGTFLLLTAGHGDAPADAHPSARRGVRLEPVVGTRGAGLSISGAF